MAVLLPLTYPSMFEDESNRNYRTDGQCSAVTLPLRSLFVKKHNPFFLKTLSGLDKSTGTIPRRMILGRAHQFHRKDVSNELAGGQWLCVDEESSMLCTTTMS